ncbi:MAG: NAD-dependent 4,6-dehydratase LegB [Nitrospirota bacterium]
MKSMKNMRGKKVLVTGADGFIGSHLVESLLEEGCRVRAFVFYNSFNSWGWLDTFSPRLLKKIEVFPGDIRDPNGVRTAVKGMDMVFHLAALIAIPFSYHSPDAYVDTNIKGTMNVLQACRDFSVKKVIVTSTSEVYGTARYVPIDEVHPLQGQSPYSATKIGADKVAESFYRSFDLPVVTVRPFNTYGPRQSARAVIPTIITQLLNGQTKLKLGSLHPTRDFNYVNDTCQGFIALARCPEAVGKEINVCSGKEISIGELAQTLIDIINPKAKIVSDEHRLRPDKSEVERLLGSNALITKLTEWRPGHSLKAGLSKTVEWFEKGEFLHKYKSDIYNI